MPINLSCSRQARPEAALLACNFIARLYSSESPVRIWYWWSAISSLSEGWMLCYSILRHDWRTVLSEPLADDRGGQAELPHLAW